MAPCHEQADLLDVRPGCVELAEDRTLEHDRDAVCKRKDLVEVFADQEHGDSVRGQVTQVGVHRLDRADVEPTCRRGRDEQSRWTGEFTRKHDLLQVSARQVPRLCVGPRRGDPVAPDQLDGPVADRAQLKKRAA